MVTDTIRLRFVFIRLNEYDRTNEYYIFDLRSSCTNNVVHPLGELTHCSIVPRFTSASRRIRRCSLVAAPSMAPNSPFVNVRVPWHADIPVCCVWETNRWSITYRCRSRCIWSCIVLQIRVLVSVRRCPAQCFRIARLERAPNSSLLGLLIPWQRIQVVLFAGIVIM